MVPSAGQLLGECRRQTRQGDLPLVATLFFFILLGNWFKLLPGAESIGCSGPHLANIPAYARLIELGPISFYTVDGTKPVEWSTPGAAAAVTCAEAEAMCTACNITPSSAGSHRSQFHAIAGAGDDGAGAGLGSAQGLRYLLKFFNLPALARARSGDRFAAGLLEIISEFSRIISFAFRLWATSSPARC
jgi:F0F1-type ATP synthase membrane subunit a